MDTARIIQVAIIGQGRSGKDIHAKLLSRMQDRYRIAAVVDGNEERRRQAAREFACDAYADHEELYSRSDIDLIVNATPSHMHVPVTLAFLQQGFHVLCEKPLAPAAADVDGLIEAAEQAKKKLAVFQQSRFSPSFVRMKQVIDSGVLGRIVRIRFANATFARRWDWQTLKRFNGGSLMNIGPHPLDQALQLFDPERMPEVTCYMDSTNSFGDAEDYVYVTLRGPGSPVVEVEISSCQTYPSNNYEVQGTRGGLKGTIGRLDWKYFKLEEAPEQQLIVEPMFHKDGSPASCTETLIWHEDNWEQKNTADTMGTAFYENLYDALVCGKPLEVTPQQVRRQIAVMEQCYWQNPRFAR